LTVVAVERKALRSRLRAAVGLAEAAPPTPAVVDTSTDFLVGGTWEDTAHGPALYLERVYDVHHTHGQFALSEIFAFAEALARLGCNERPEDLVFLDVETTGLNGGTGTLAFLVGAARFQDGTMVLRQYFLPRPHFEPAMLAGLSRFVGGARQVVTYNGSSFDMPLLQSRYTLARLSAHLIELPQFDLLHPTRRFYARSLESCRLKDLESQVLGVDRGSDIPGWAAPQVYFSFVREGVVGMMPAVIRHNATDVLSLVTLLRKIAGLVAGERFTLPAEAIELARLAHLAGDVDSSLAYHRSALNLAAGPRLRDYALSRHLLVLKQARRWPEVRDLCLDEIRSGSASPLVYIEAAKACEHHTRELRLGLRLVEAALLRTRLRSHHESLASELEKRRARLLRKLARAARNKEEATLRRPLVVSEITRLPLPAQSLA
jgi:uncharacterized protein YprB with RNaseH-like and TPR domain